MGVPEIPMAFVDDRYPRLPGDRGMERFRLEPSGNEYVRNAILTWLLAGALALLIVIAWGLGSLIFSGTWVLPWRSVIMMLIGAVIGQVMHTAATILRLLRESSRDRKGGDCP